MRDSDGCKGKLDSKLHCYGTIELSIVGDYQADKTVLLEYCQACYFKAHEYLTGTNLATEAWME